MTPTHKVTIGNEVFMASEKCNESYKIKDIWFTYIELKALNAKIEEIVPFRFEADVFWERSNAVHPVMDNLTKCNHADGFKCLIGKRGKLIFTEEV